MNKAEVQKRLEEERLESAGWAEVLANFSQGYFPSSTARTAEQIDSSSI